MQIYLETDIFLLLLLSTLSSPHLSFGNALTERKKKHRVLCKCLHSPQCNQLLVEYEKRYWSERGEMKIFETSFMPAKVDFLLEKFKKN
jgi:hypothetical protein